MQKLLNTKYQERRGDLKQLVNQFRVAIQQFEQVGSCRHRDNLTSLVARKGVVAAPRKPCRGRLTQM